MPKGFKIKCAHFLKLTHVPEISLVFEFDNLFTTQACQSFGGV